MMSILLKGRTKLASFVSRCTVAKAYSFCSTPCSRETGSFPLTSTSHIDGSGGYNMELVDNVAWQVSSGLANAWRETDRLIEMRNSREVEDKMVDDKTTTSEDDLDYDEIDNMRIRGNLFYKLDRLSKEFEEYSYDFHRRRKSSDKDSPDECAKKEISKRKEDKKVMKLPELAKDEKVYSLVDEFDTMRKRLRKPTYNQLTGPYHEPFCLDIYISKASVRACVIHRVTSNVVAVAHSISKDMKFDLNSTRNASACAAVGRILAQRALEDDIHDVVYTPRKGEKLEEGKLQVVLEAFIQGGINLKVKLKQRNIKKSFPTVV